MAVHSNTGWVPRYFSLDTLLRFSIFTTFIISCCRDSASLEIHAKEFEKWDAKKTVDVSTTLMLNCEHPVPNGCAFYTGPQQKMVNQS